MFKHGTNKERGCTGKKSGCKEFNPSLCKDSFSGSCEKDCTKGFHLRSIQKAANRRNSGEREDAPKERTKPQDGCNGCNCKNTQEPKASATETPPKTTEVAVSEVKDSASDKDKSFLEEILASIKSIKEGQEKQ